MKKVSNESLPEVTAIESGTLFEDLKGVSTKTFLDVVSVCNAKDEPVFAPDI